MDLKEKQNFIARSATKDYDQLMMEIRDIDKDIIRLGQMRKILSDLAYMHMISGGMVD